MGTLVATLSTRSEENIGVSWVSENTLDKLWYSINNGQSYVLTDQTGIDGYLGFYDLTPNTNYKIKFRMWKSYKKIWKKTINSKWT